MNHDSWLSIHHSSNIDSQFPNQFTCPHLYSVSLYTVLDAMNHESWLLSHPTSNFFGRGRGHYCPDQFLKVLRRLDQALESQPVTTPRIPNLPPDPPLYCQPASPAGWCPQIWDYGPSLPCLWLLPPSIIHATSLATSVLVLISLRLSMNIIYGLPQNSEDI